MHIQPKAWTGRLLLLVSHEMNLSWKFDNGERELLKCHDACHRNGETDAFPVFSLLPRLDFYMRL